MKKLLDKILSIPVPYIIALTITSIILVVLKTQGNITTFGIIGVIVIGLIIGLQSHLGSVVIKSAISSFVVMYVISLYTYLSIDAFGYITQPFLLSFASVTIFLAQTYSVKSHNYSLRSRALWSSILSIVLISAKSAVIISGVGYWAAEAVGLNVLVMFIFGWRLWITNSKKTKIVEPTIVKEEIQNKFRFIYIENKLNESDSKWTKGAFTSPTNAYPYIYNEVIRAREDGLLLVLVSTLDTDKYYDVGEISLNNANTIPYLYMEAKEDDYFDEIMAGFISEISDNHFKES